jgi:integrase
MDLSSSVHATGSSQTDLLQGSHSTDILQAAQPKQRRNRKSMRRRSGQNGTIVIQSDWYRVRWRQDIEGQQERINMTAKIAPVAFDKDGNPKPASPEIRRKAREIVEQSGANSENRFNQVVVGDITFREQAEVYLKSAVSRKRNPLRDTVSVEGALNKWVYPAIGDLPVSQVDNLTLKPLIEKMSGSLSARTVNKYVEYIKQVVKALKAPNGEPVFNRTWDAEVMDLPIVEYSEQKRPSLKATTVSGLITGSTGQEQALYVLLAATGMRISEALGLEVRHIINDGRTIKVEQQIGKDRPEIVKYLKTNAAKREIDLHPDVAEYLRQYAVGKSGVLFHTANGTPHLYGNLEDRWLTPRLVKLKLDERGMGWHAFKRFRKTWLRGARCLEDINNFWMAHKPKTMSEVYSHLHEELEMRLAESERVGYGFTIPKLVAPSAPKISTSESLQIAA